MKKNRISTLALAALCLGALASCVEQPAQKKEFTPDDVVAKVAGSGAIAIWSDTGEVIKPYAADGKGGKKSRNQSYGAHSPYLAKTFTVKDETDKSYTANIEWTGFDAEKWKAYADEDGAHITLIPVRPLHGESAMDLDLTCTVTYEGKTATVPYRFQCPAYPVEFADYTLEELANGFYKTGEIRSGTMVRIHGYVSAKNYDNSNVYVQDGNYGICLYRASAFNYFYKVGNWVDVVGQIKNYSGLEFDPVSDVSFSTVEQPEGGFAGVIPMTDEVIDGVKTNAAQGKDYVYSNLLAGGEAVAMACPYNSLQASKDNTNQNVLGHTWQESDGESAINLYKYDGAIGNGDTVWLRSESEGSTKDFELYLKAAFLGSADFDAAKEKIKNIKAGDRVRYKGVTTYYSGGSLVELNIMNVNDIEVIPAN